MKKSLLALATLGAFAGAAQAQSSVTVYGIYDGGYNTRKDDTTTAGAKTSTSTGGFQGGAQASSRIGFRGVESIGGGTSALFNLEIGIAPGTGAMTTTTTAGVVAGQQETGLRASTVGLTNAKFGTLNIGRALTGIHTIVAGTVFAGNNMVGDLAYTNMVGGTSYGTQTRIHANATRMSNAVMYTTPTFSGFSARADYSADRATTADNPNQSTVGNVGLTAGYVNGPFTARAGFHKVKGNNTTAVTASGFTASAANYGAYSDVRTTDIQAYSLRYSDKGLTGELIYGRNETKSATAQTSKVNATQLAVSYAVGAVTPFAKYGIGKTETGISGAADADTSGMQLGATYAMSKRTNVYAAYGQQTIKVKKSTTAALVDNKVNAQQMAVGLMHTF